MLHDLLAGVVRTGEAFWGKDLLFKLERHGFPEETYFDVSYDPVRVESGEVGGVYCIVTETTERVVGERRMALLKDLAARNATARTTRDACVLAMETLAAKPQDVTFALAYLDDELQSCTPERRSSCGRDRPTWSRSFRSRRPASEAPAGTAGRRPQSAAARSTTSTARSSSSSPTSSAPRCNARAYEEERKRAEALPSSIARRRRSSATSATSSARR